MSAQKGFTLVELLVVIAIIGVLSVVGVVIFTNVQKSARDATRRADIDAIAKAYEIKAATGKYEAISDNDFSAGKIPKDPSGDDYYNVLANDGSGFKVCAALDNHPTRLCNSQSATCFCKSSAQGTISSGTLTGTGAELGTGGSLLHPSSCDPSGVLDDGLVAYWRLDEGSGSVAEDSSQGNNASLVNSPAWTTGKFNGALNFLGGGKYAAASPSKTGRSFVTISGWVNFDTPDNINQIDRYHFLFGWVHELFILFRTYTSEPGPGYFVWLAGNTTSPLNVLYGFPQKLSGWHHLAISYNGSAAKIYFDGDEVSSQNNSSSGIANADRAFTIGGSPEHTYFDGMIDDVRVYYRALYSNEIKSLYAGGQGCIP